ncbi:MAG: hypothetical protein Q6373_010410 [Candidatus Sigynarchaeota archaeon]
MEPRVNAINIDKGPMFVHAPRVAAGAAAVAARAAPGLCSDGSRRSGTRAFVGPGVRSWHI